jgi:hypothetical protein
MASLALTHHVALASGSGVYHVLLIDQTEAQGYSFPVAATHSADVHMFQVGEMASAQAASIAQIGTPVPMYNLLLSLLGTTVTDIYVHAFPVASAGNPTAFWQTGLPYFDPTRTPPGLYPTTSDHNLSDHIAFDITANPGDVFSLARMMMCTNDGLAGLDAVELPTKVGKTMKYKVRAYDAGVEQNTERGPEIVDPCGLMAPYGSDGQPQVSTTDGNSNSPPSGTNTAIQETNPIAPFRNPTIVGIGDIPEDFGWKGAKAPVGEITITKIN